jgi:hypothetical protein
MEYLLDLGHANLVHNRNLFLTSSRKGTPLIFFSFFHASERPQSSHLTPLSFYFFTVVFTFTVYGTHSFSFNQQSGRGGGGRQVCVKRLFLILSSSPHSIIIFILLLGKPTGDKNVCFHHFATD